jgi:hypothetical protein
MILILGEMFLGGFDTVDFTRLILYQDGEKMT